MEIRRFFVSPTDVIGGIVTMRGEEFRHMTRVLRYKNGYKLIVCTGDGYDLDCTLTEIGEDCACARVDDRTINDAAPKTKIALFQGLPKGDKADFIIQKAVELGASRVCFFTSRYTACERFDVVRGCRVALEACKQCGLAVVPKIDELTDFDAALKAARQYDETVMPYEGEKKRSIHECGLARGVSTALIVGGEGGFSDEEAEAAQRVGARLITLGPRILRCETAAVAALTLVADETGEMFGE